MTKAVQRLVRIEADAQGNPPESIHLLSVGHWHTPWHGAFEHTPEDLAAMVINFEDGVGLVENDGKMEAPGNYGHDRGGPAAFWIYGLYLDNNGTELWGKTRWTKAGAQALKDEEYKYISPEWNPREFPWENPEVEGEFVENVFTGAALTNIPLFKKLTPVMASADAGGSGKGKSNQEGDSMDLETVRVKKLEELNDEEKVFLEEHKADLTDEERTTFGLVETEETDEEKAAREAKEAADAEAAGQPKAGSTGTVTIDAAKLASLEADAKAGRDAQTQLLKADVTAKVTKHIERGAIKSDELTSTVDMLMASDEKTRESVLNVFEKLPDNKLVSAAAGKATDIEGSVEVTDEELGIGADFNLTEEQIREYKKANAKEGK